MNKLKTYIAFFAATLGLTSSVFFADSIIKQYSEPENVSSSFGFIFALVSAALWAVYVLLYFIIQSRTNKKRKK